MVNFFNKELKEALDYLDTLAENAQSWEIFNLARRTKPSNASQPIGGGKYVLRDQDELHSKIAKLCYKLEDLEVKRVRR